VPLKVPAGNRCYPPKGLNCKEINERSMCGDVVRIKEINKGE
jgi:hypothetical protein